MASDMMNDMKTLVEKVLYYNAICELVRYVDFRTRLQMLDKGPLQ